MGKAAATASEQLDDMAGNLAVDMARHVGETAVVYVGHGAALQADEVVMVARVRAEVVIKLAVRVEDLGQHPLVG
jgi:hypothetical protein